jgi:hypothetical protein
MAARPDYSAAREQAGFTYSASSSQGALREITGTPIREFNLDPGPCIEAYRRGRPMIREMFGEGVSLPGVTTPAISYGHVNCLGSELLFPEGGEVAQTHIYDSLEQGLEALRQPVDFAATGMAPFYLEFRERMQEAFPGEPVGFSFGLEGPITTAYEVRGDGFFTDIFDGLDLVQEFMQALTDSILGFHRVICAVHDRPVINPNGAGMCDDLSSFVPPRLFPNVVLPYWDQYYSGMTTGRRTAHVEDLRAEQLPFLEEIGLTWYDPSISPKLNPQIIAANCRVPFAWRLGSFHYREMTCRDVEDFVFQAAADGASAVTTNVAETMCNSEGVAKVHAFIGAAKEAKRLVADGCSRGEIGQRVSAEGKQKLWDAWCGYASALSSRGGPPRPR